VAGQAVDRENASADAAGIIRWRGLSGRRYCHVVTQDPPTGVSARSVKDRPLYTS